MGIAITISSGCEEVSELFCGESFAILFAILLSNQSLVSSVFWITLFDVALGEFVADLLAC